MKKETQTKFCLCDGDNARARAAADHINALFDGMNEYPHQSTFATSYALGQMELDLRRAYERIEDLTRELKHKEETKWNL